MVPLESASSSCEMTGTLGPSGAMSRGCWCHCSKGRIAKHEFRKVLLKDIEYILLMEAQDSLFIDKSNFILCEVMEAGIKIYISLRIRVD
jgi:hypothetical protein